MHGYQFCTSLALQFHARPSVHDFRLTLNAVASGDLTLWISGGASAASGVRWIQLLDVIYPFFVALPTVIRLLAFG